MAKRTTPNLGLKISDYDEFVDVKELADNFDAIDDAHNDTNALINAEATSRSNADSALQTAITDEVAQRVALASTVATLGNEAGKLAENETVTGLWNYTQNPTIGGVPIATRSYADAIAQGLQTKAAVTAATTGPLPTSTRLNNVITADANGALPTIDGVALTAGDSLLVKNQVDETSNGIYTVTAVGSGGSPWILTRRPDADESAEVKTGMYCLVVNGTVNASSGWTLSTPGTITLNTTALEFSQFSSASDIEAGTGLNKAGNVLNVVYGPGGAALDDDVVHDTGDQTVNGIKNFADGVQVAGADVATQAFVTNITDTKAQAFSFRKVDDQDDTIAAWEKLEYVCRNGIRTLTVPNSLPVGTEIYVTVSEVGSGKQLNISFQGIRFGNANASSGATLVSLTGSGEFLHARRMVSGTGVAYWYPVARGQTPATLQAAMDDKDDVVLSTAKTYTDTQIATNLANVDLSTLTNSGGKIRVKGVTGSNEYFLRIASNGDLVADPLMYERPDFSTWKKVQIVDKTHIKVNNGSTQSWFGNNIEAGDFGILTGENVVFYLPQTTTLGRLGGVALGKNMGNVAIIGGEFYVDETIFPPPYGPGVYSPSDRMNLTINAPRGDIWLEGLYIHGPRLGDAIRLNVASTGTGGVTVQNVHVGNLGAPGGGPAADSRAATFGGTDANGDFWDSSTFQHADCLQFLSNSRWGSVGKLQLYQTVFKTGYQGILTNQALARGIELDRFYFESQTTTNWDGSHAPGYGVGFFAGRTALEAMPKVIGEDVRSFIYTGLGRNTDWYSDTTPPDADQPANYKVTKSDYVDPSWIRADYGKLYVPPEPFVIMSAEDVMAMIAAHASATTNVHGFADTNRVPRVVNAGSVLTTARPVTSAPVIWTATGDPVNAVDGDIILEYTP